jgi:hypothetical protein
VKSKNKDKETPVSGRTSCPCGDKQYELVIDEEDIDDALFCPFCGDYINTLDESPLDEEQE